VEIRCALCAYFSSFLAPTRSFSKHAHAFACIPRIKCNISLSGEFCLNLLLLIATISSRKAEYCNRIYVYGHLFRPSPNTKLLFIADVRWLSMRKIPLKISWLRNKLPSFFGTNAPPPQNFITIITISADSTEQLTYLDDILAMFNNHNNTSLYRGMSSSSTMMNMSNDSKAS